MPSAGVEYEVEESAPPVTYSVVDLGDDEVAIVPTIAVQRTGSTTVEPCVDEADPAPRVSRRGSDLVIRSVLDDRRLNRCIEAGIPAGSLALSSEIRLIPEQGRRILLGDASRLVVVTPTPDAENTITRDGTPTPDDLRDLPLLDPRP